MRTVPDHQIGPGVDGRMRERLRITRFSPKLCSVPPVTASASGPSAPMCAWTTTRSACSAAARTT
ncbi:hypothetical protein AB1285_20720 [Microbacterium sp. NRRL B-14842]|uniref:hypothetical protein n=1 Tax=Microbacterium sp. NRRL B-14842 TaxID=3162881 RepID=UPI003D2A6C48